MLSVHSSVSLRSLGAGGGSVFLGILSCTGSCTGTRIGVVGRVGMGVRAGVRIGVRRSGVLATDKVDEGSAREKGLAVWRRSGLNTNAGGGGSLNRPRADSSVVSSPGVWLERAQPPSPAVSDIASSAGWGSGSGSSTPRRHSTSMWGPPCCGRTHPTRSSLGRTPRHVRRLAASRVSSRPTRTCNLLLGRPRQRSGERTSPAPSSSSRALRGEVLPMQSGRWRERRVLRTGLSAATYSCYR